FFFQAEDGIRDRSVTGVQTCALPILEAKGWSSGRVGLLLTAILAGTALMSIAVGTLGDRIGRRRFYASLFLILAAAGIVFAATRSEERRVGKEGRAVWWACRRSRQPK